MSSILGSKPFVDKILSKLQPADITTLLTLVNNPGVPTTVYLYGNESVLNDSHKGVHYVQLMVDKLIKRYLYGFLVFIDNDNCGFFAFSGKQSPMVEIEINPVTFAHRDLYENLSAEEFRRTLVDLSIESGQVSGYVTEEELEAILNGKLGNIDVNSLPAFAIVSYADDDIIIESKLLDPTEWLKVKDKCLKFIGSEGMNELVLYPVYYYDEADIVYMVIKKELLRFYNVYINEGVLEIETLDIDLSQIGQGGTKWYRHHITADEDGEENKDIDIIVFSTSSTPYDGIPSLLPGNAVFVQGSIEDYRQHVYDILLLNYDRTNSSMVVCDTSGLAISLLPVSGPFTNYQDTVTEL